MAVNATSDDAQEQGSSMDKDVVFLMIAILVTLLLIAAALVGLFLVIRERKRRRLAKKKQKKGSDVLYQLPSVEDTQKTLDETIKSS